MCTLLSLPILKQHNGERGSWKVTVKPCAYHYSTNSDILEKTQKTCKFFQVTDRKEATNGWHNTRGPIDA